MDELIRFWNTYPYLMSCVLTLGLLAVLCAVSPRLRATTLLSGVLHMILIIGYRLAPNAGQVQQDYWNPARVGGPMGWHEDVLFGFVFSALSWFLAACVFGSRLSVSVQWAAVLRRFVFVHSVAVGAFLLGLGLGLGSMTSSFLLFGVVAGLLLLVRRSIWPLVVSGGVVFGATYVAMARVFLWIWPDFVLAWNGEVVWCRRVLGVPLGEIGWGILFGAAWAAYMAYTLDARLDRAASGVSGGAEPEGVVY